MQKGNFLLVIIIPVLFSGCAVSKQYNPAKKFSRQELQQDYSLLRNILEKKHPALYWYTPKDSMNYYFDSLYNNIADSMTELQFGWKILAPLTNKIHCGHTSFGMSKNWNKFMKGKRIPSFPLYVKLWGDTMVVTGNLNRKDSLIKRGTQLTSVNGVRNSELVQKMFQYLPLDGYSDNVNYTRLSSNFPYYHRNIFGIYKNYRVGYVDSTGKERRTILQSYNPVTDTAEKKKIAHLEKPPRKKIKKEQRESYRSLEIDTGTRTATLSLNTFLNGEGRHLRPFLKRSFRKISQQKIKNLIIDLRSNGGGDVTMYVKLTRYIRNAKFKVADSSYAVTKNLAPYTSYIKNGFFNNVGLVFLTKKHRDGNYHFGYWERHTYHPKTRHHFGGKVYVLTNGPTFSASTLFCNAVKGQSNVTIVGEETGGGWHGNSGIMIPDITLPITKLRVRLPLFKLVQYKHVPKDGRGISPDIFIPPTLEGVRQNIDRKMVIVKGLIIKSTATEGYQ
ncbi:MAG: peptidase S41 [Ferruginibacter sp.]|nr:peptidase S41 [Ferruginibacter sp.]